MQTVLLFCNLFELILNSKFAANNVFLKDTLGGAQKMEVEYKSVTEAAK